MYHKDGAMGYEIEDFFLELKIHVIFMVWSLLDLHIQVSYESRNDKEKLEKIKKK